MDVAILKKTGVFDVEKMRTIILINEEYNMMSKLMGKQVALFAESHQALEPEQYGRHNCHHAIIAALNKHLTTDLWCLQCSSGALCSNDIKSCFDRIAHPRAILALEPFPRMQFTVHS